MKLVKFYRVKEPYGCFSNFSPHPIVLDYTTWYTSEHYFQAQKFLDHSHRLEIQNTKSPMEAANIGRDRSRPLRSDWENIKDEVMRKTVKAKVMQHADVRETLLSTEDAKIIEHTHNDSYWGDGGDGSGKNMLGIILMEIRDELLRNGSFDELSNPLNPPWIQYPELQQGSIGWRMGHGEHYLLDEWAPWYTGLSAEGKAKYKQMFPQPQEWQGFYVAQEQAFEQRIKVRV